MTEQPSLPGTPIDEPDVEHSSLLLFSLGPVQDFIAAARKTADLWAGSYLPAWLSWRAMQTVREEYGPEALLFPDVEGQPLAELEQGARPESLNAATLPNRFLAVVPDDKANALAEAAQHAVQEAFSNVVTFALDEAKIYEDYPHRLARQQAETFLECYWSILPPDADLDAYFDWSGAPGVTPYGRRYRTAEGLLGARKALRDFATADAPGYRCALIPRLAALIEHENDRPGAVRLYWEHLARRNPHGRLQQGERLSAVALAKRFFPDFLKERVLDAQPSLSVDARFPSTSSFATADFKADVLQACPQNDALRDAVVAYEEATGPLLQKGQREAPVPGLRGPAQTAGVESFHEISGRWLFEESLDPDYLERQDIKLGDQKREKVVRALHALLAAARDAGIDPPSKYYALLLLDGDRMGQWLSGEKAPGGREASQSYHRAVSRALNHFALHHVRRVVEEEHRGRRVYGGGDDVLAFVSFRDALPAGRALRAAFSAHLGSQGTVDWTRAQPFNGSGSSPTLGYTATASAGLVFAHHLQDLGQVRASAREAEHYAKSTLERNALAFSIMKRSGEHLLTGMKWNTKTDGGGPVDLTAALERFADRVREGDLASSFLFDFEELVRKLGLMPEGEDASSAPASFTGAREALRSEAWRLFKRRTEKSEHLNTDAEKQVVFDATVGQLLDEAPPYQVVRLLDVAQFLARGGAR